MRQVVALAAHRSFVRAAADLGISQPTLSKSLARLEDELGLKLFDRSPAGVLPTPIGRIVTERARVIIDETARLKREAQLLSIGQVGQIRIGVGLALGPVFLPRLALALAQTYPNLRQRVIVEQRHRLLRELISGDLDLVFLAFAVDLAEYDLSTFEVMRHQMVAVAAPDHPLAGRAQISAEEFALHQGVANTTANVFLHRDLLGLDREIEDHSSHVVTDEFHVVRTLVSMGGATSMGPRHVFEEDICSGEMVVLDVPRLSAWSKTVAAMMGPSVHSSLITAVVEIAKTVGTTLGPQEPA